MIYDIQPNSDAPLPPTLGRQTDRLYSHPYTRHDFFLFRPATPPDLNPHALFLAQNIFFYVFKVFTKQRKVYSA